jgi:hypothetical protein
VKLKKQLSGKASELLDVLACYTAWGASGLHVGKDGAEITVAARPSDKMRSTLLSLLQRCTMIPVRLTGSPVVNLQGVHAEAARRGLYLTHIFTRNSSALFASVGLKKVEEDLLGVQVVQDSLLEDDGTQVYVLSRLPVRSLIVASVVLKGEAP